MNSVIKVLFIAYAGAMFSTSARASENTDWFLQKEANTMKTRVCARGSKDSESYESALHAWLEKHKAEIELQEKRLTDEVKDAMLSDVQSIESIWPEPNTENFSRLCAKLLKELRP